MLHSIGSLPNLYSKRQSESEQKPGVKNDLPLQILFEKAVKGGFSDRERAIKAIKEQLPSPPEKATAEELEIIQNTLPSITPSPFIPEQFKRYLNEILNHSIR